MLYTTRNLQVMKQYQLGPNGGIMTALNLFATKFDQVRSRTQFFFMPSLTRLTLPAIPQVAVRSNSTRAGPRQVLGPYRGISPRLKRPAP